MSLSAGDKLGPYEILAIKVSQERFSDRFEREARAIAALNHPTSAPSTAIPLR